MNECNFYTPEGVKPLYGEIVPAYQVAFSGEPWNEVSKCADENLRCTGGLSSLAIGATCEVCGNCPERPAYEADELTDAFDALGSTRPTAWYIEQNENGVTLAVIAWKATADVIAQEKYNGNSEMSEWMTRKFGNDEIMWLDEVFANKSLKSKGNLQNFGKFVTGLADILNTETIAYRTIEPRMLVAPRRDFDQDSSIFERQEDNPDRRDFVVINMGRENQ